QLEHRHGLAVGHDDRARRVLQPLVHARAEVVVGDLSLAGEALVGPPAKEAEQRQVDERTNDQTPPRSGLGGFARRWLGLAVHGHDCARSRRGWRTAPRAARTGCRTRIRAGSAMRARSPEDQLFGRSATCVCPCRVTEVFARFSPTLPAAEYTAPGHNSLRERDVR